MMNAGGLARYAELYPTGKKICPQLRTLYYVHAWNIMCGYLKHVMCSPQKLYSKPVAGKQETG